MNNYDIKRLALILAVQAEIEGMKAENKKKEILGHQIAYNEDSFLIKADNLKELANKHDYQL